MKIIFIYAALAACMIVSYSVVITVSNEPVKQSRNDRIAQEELIEQCELTLPRTERCVLIAVPEKEALNDEK
jgi:hypothetical protein